MARRRRGVAAAAAAFAGACASLHGAGHAFAAGSWALRCGPARQRRAHVALRAQPQPWEDDYVRPPLKVFQDDFSDDDIQKFYEETISGSGGPPPAGRVQDLITKYFLWDFKLHDDDVYTDEDHAAAFEKMKKQLNDQTWCTYGGTNQQTANDGKGWVWLAADVTIVGLCLQIFNSIPYGRRPLLVAKDDEVDEMFEKLSWSKFEERLDKEIGTVIQTEPNIGSQWLEEYGFSPEVFKISIAGSGASSAQAPAAAPVAAAPAPAPAPAPEPAPPPAQEAPAAPAEAASQFSAEQLARVEEVCTLDGQRLFDGNGVTSWDEVRERLQLLTTGQLKRINLACSLDPSVPKAQKLDNLWKHLRESTA